MMPSTSVPENNEQQEIKPERKMVALDLSKEERCRLYQEQSNRIARNLAILRGMAKRHEEDCESLQSGNRRTNTDTPVDKDLQQKFYKKPLASGNRFPFPPGHNLDWQTSKCLPLCIKCDVKNKAYEFIASYFTDRKERKDSGTFEELFPNGYPKNSILDRRSRPFNCPGCVEHQKKYKEGRKKFFAEQLSKYVTKQMVCRDINNITNIKYPPKTINRLIVEYVKENINFDWVSRYEANLQYLNARKAHYDKSDKLDETDLAQCFAVLIENMDVTVLQDSNVLRLQQNTPSYASQEQEWLRSVFPGLQLS